MELRGRALYNLLRANWQENPSLAVEDWQIANLREISTSQIFEQLQDLGISSERASFRAYAEECDGPEELADLLTDEKNPQDIRERIYLLLFELWRRELPERQTLSIFCDELDQLIALYDRGILASDEKVEQVLDDLENILDESVDAGLQPREAFQLVNEFCAHDVETFLYDYLSDKIDTGQELQASEMIDGFYDYVEDVRWFDFLRVRLFAKTHTSEFDPALARLIESLTEKPDFDLAMETAAFLVHEGSPEQFALAVEVCLELIVTEEDFQQLLAIVADYHDCLDQAEQLRAIEELFKRRATRDLSQPINRADSDLVAVRSLLR